MKNERLGIAGALYGQFHRVAWPTVKIGFVRTNVGVQRSPIYANNAVANAQAGAFRRASFYHIFDCLVVRFLVILRVVVVIKAEFHRRARATHGVHPEGTVNDRNHGKQGRQCCQERFSERRAAPHDFKCRHRAESSGRILFPASDAVKNHTALQQPSPAVRLRHLHPPKSHLPDRWCTSGPLMLRVLSHLSFRSAAH